MVLGIQPTDLLAFQHCWQYNDNCIALCCKASALNAAKCPPSLPTVLFYHHLPATTTQCMRPPLQHT